jgi:glycosyltransferase involved in cell wall biosynthesis
MDYSEVAFIIPVYNEGEVIGSVIEKLKKDFDYIICVDDGSKDNSRIEIENSGVFLVQHPINMGQGAAIQTGIEFARQIKNIKYFVTYDADGQHRVQDVKEMLKVIVTGRYDIVLGSRFLGKAEGINKSKYLLLKLAIFFSNITSGIKLTDTHNGLRVFNRLFAEKLQITLSDMSHASEIIEIIAQGKYRYTEIPVIIEYTDYSRSKGQSIINAVNIGFDTLIRKITK